MKIVMNARQKAKKYKRDLEFFKKTLPKYEIHTDDRKVVVLTIEERYPLEMLSSIKPSVIVDSLYSKFATSEEFRKIVSLDNHYDEQTDSMIFKAEIAAVAKKDR